MAVLTWMVVLVFCATSVDAGKYIINAAILGYTNHTNIDVYKAISEITLADRNAVDNFCEIRLQEIDYDNTNPETVYNSLTNARNAFETGDITVAIGPFIDVFTSPDYVVLDQYHFLTSGYFHHHDIVPILPDLKSVSVAIASIVTKFKWQKVAFLSQDDFSPALELGKLKTLVWPMRLPDNIVGNGNSELKRMLISLREARLDKIILHSMKKDVIEEVVAQAQELHLLHHSIDWFITYMDFKDIDIGESWSGSVYGLQLLKEQRLPENITSLPMSQDFSRLDLGVMIDSINLLRHNIWPFAELFGDCSTEPPGDTIMSADRLKGMLKMISNPFDGILGRYQWPKEGENARTEYEINIIKRTEVSTSSKQQRDTMVRGRSEKVGIVKFEQEKMKIEIWADERGPKSHKLNAKMVVTTKLDDPFVMDDGNGGYIGFCIDLVNKIAEELNIEVTFTDIRENGEIEGSGEIDDMLKGLVFGNASMAIGAIPVTATREEIISSSFTILSTDASMLIKKSDGSKNYFQFLGPFSVDLWVTIIGYFFVVAFALYLMSRFDHSKQAAEQKFDLKDSIWYALNVLLQGATDFSPQTTSTRTMIASFWLVVLVINAAYTANLAAYLTLQQIDDRIKNIHDLAVQTKVKYGVRKNSEISKFFENAKEDPYERMWGFMKINEDTSLIDPQNASDIVAMVLGGEFVYIADGVVNKYYEQQYCGVESIGLNFGYKHFGMAFPKGAPYKDDVNGQLLILKESGYLDTLKAKWWAPRSNCTGNQASVSVKQRSRTAELQLESMFGVFIILIVCVIIAVCVQLGKFVDKIANRKPRRKEKVEPSDSNDVVVRLNPPRESQYKAFYEQDGEPAKKETDI